MSARIDLAQLHTRVVCIQAECALWQIRRQWERLLATTMDEARRVQIAELLREGRCPPDEVIRGAHGYFAGCASKGPQNTAFHRQHDWAKEVGGQKYAGLKHEAEAHYQRNVKGNEEKAKDAEDKAAKAAAKLTSEQRQELQGLLDRLDTETLRLGDELKAATKGSAEWKALTKEIGLRGKEAQLVYEHLKRADVAAKSAPAPKASGRTSGAKGERSTDHIAAAKALISKGLRTDADVVAVGEHLRTHIDEQLAALRPAYDRARHLMTTPEEQWSAADKEFAQSGMAKALQAYERTQQRVMMETLRQFRAFGGKLEGPVSTGEHMIGPNAARDKRFQQILDTTAEYLPSDWIHASNSSKPAISYIMWSNATQNSTMYMPSGYLQVYVPKGSPAAVRAMGATLVAHEMGHRFEQVIPHLSELAKQFYDRRTAGKGSAVNEFGWEYKEGFPHSHMGRNPVDRGTYTETEVIAFSLENLLPMSAMRRDIRQDPELYAFMLGLLAGA